MPTASGNVRVRGQSGKHVLVLSSSQFDPGRVKTLFILQKLHAAGRDPRRREHLSIFCCIESGVNPGPTTGRAERWGFHTAWTRSGRRLGGGRIEGACGTNPKKCHQCGQYHANSHGWTVTRECAVL